MSLRVKVTPKARYAFPCRHPDLVVRLVRSSRAQSLSDSAGAFLYSLGLIRMASPQAICVSPHLVPKANSKFAESVCHRAFRVSQYTSQKLSGYASEIVPGKLHGYVCHRSVRFRMMRRRNCQKICWKICRGNGQEICQDIARIGRINVTKSPKKHICQRHGARYAKRYVAIDAAYSNATTFL